MNPIILYRDFDIEKVELSAMRQHFHTIQNRTNVRHGDLVIGRYSVLPFYKETADDISIMGGRLINSFKNHNYIADLRNWYADLEEFTPKTWFDPGSVPMDHPGSFVLKGHTNSKKFLWDTHMFAATRAQVGEVTARLLGDSLVSSQNIYVREYIPLHTYTVGLRGLPITEEYRFFICNGKVLSGAFYWSSHVEDLKYLNIEVPLASNVPQSFLDEIISRVGDNAVFWVLDIAKTADGRWIVVELNDGQMSGLSENDPAILYKNLKSSVELI